MSLVLFSHSKIACHFFELGRGVPDNKNRVDAGLINDENHDFPPE
ncbi:MAG: hypothetical protein ACTSWN_11040 [Promethearchaeota archaeon]